MGEYENLSALNEVMEELNALNDYEIEEVEVIMECQGTTIAEAIEIQQVYYSGVDSYTELAEMFVDEDYWEKFQKT